MAEKEVFRKVSLERLSSPEELDQQLTITSPMGWAAYFAVALLIAAGLIWGFLGSIADKTNGAGIIISTGGVLNVAHHISGQVTEVSVKDGDFVEKGDVLMRIDQAPAVEEINQLKQDLRIIRSLDVNAGAQVDTGSLNYRLYQEIIDLANKIRSAQAELKAQRTNYEYQLKQARSEVEQARSEVDLAGIELENSRDYYTKLAALQEQGAVSLQELKDAEEKVKTGETVFKIKQQRLQSLQGIDKEYYLSQLDQAAQNLQTFKQQMTDLLIIKENELQQEIRKKQDELLNDCEVISPVTGRVLEVSVRKGNLLTAGKSVCTIVKSSKQTESLEAVLYVPVEKGKLILPGMDVNISPTTVKKEEYGFMLGKVVSVSEYPASTEGMMLTLGNRELVARLAGEKAPLEVRVSLINDNSTVSGYRWSTPEGPPLNVDSGTLCLGEIKVSKQRPVSLMIPFLKKILPL